MERYGSIESVLRAEIVEHQQANDALQRALDAEREKVKRLSTCGTDHSTPWWQVKCEDLEAQLATIRAQLRQVEGQSKQQAEEAVIVFAKYTTLRQLVSALPVVDVQEVSVWLSPDESGWLVSKRPAFPAGLYWAKFRTQAEADSFRALLAYRATLAAQDAKDAPLTEEQRHIENCCEKPHDCKWGGLGGCGYAGRKYEAREGVK